MSTDTSYPFDTASLFSKMLKHIPSDAYWIVKLAFHPEIAYFKAHRR
jgi:hypothetical protein